MEIVVRLLAEALGLRVDVLLHLRNRLHDLARELGADGAAAEVLHFEARAVRDHAERHFSSMAMARKYHHLYMSILSGGLSPVERDEEAA